ncbi:MAG: type I 3-dehydroquinate dehydratase [Deltaproteobacteria bacterium]|nr:type I 3-dehydroquinate dehydratase [Deltaproteobacteria bacterium]
MTLLADPPLVVGTISPAGLAALAAQPAAQRVVDIVEARLDLAIAPESAGTTPSNPLPDLRPFFATLAQLEQTGTPVLATIRLIADGGRWTEDRGRLPWFDQLLSVVSWVDVEVDSAIAGDVARLARARGRRVIISHHDFTGTPDAAALDALVERARKIGGSGSGGGDIVKIATAITSLDDHDQLIDLLRRQRTRSGVPPSAPASVALIGMGALGTPLRSFLPSVGSRLTYGYLDAIVAPGQIHAHQLVQRLVADCPAYADWRRRQGLL